MFKFRIFSIITIFFISLQAFADDVTTELQHRLSLLEQYKADFKQTITQKNGKVTAQSSGNLQIKRPYYFKMHTIEPNENFLISNGKDVWFYDPFIEQVTIYDWQKIQLNSPLLLITKNDTNLWQKYKITQDFDTFTLMPKDGGAKLLIRIDEDGVLKSFAIIEINQTNLYQLQNIISENTSNDIFEFKIPENTAIDDQR